MISIQSILSGYLSPDLMASICINYVWLSSQASPGSIHDTGCLGLVHWDDPEGWYGEGGGFSMGNTCIPVADSF